MLFKRKFRDWFKKYLKFNKVVDYRSKIFFQENDIVDTAVYSQHFFYEKENKIFESAFKKQNKIFESVRRIRRAK